MNFNFSFFLKKYCYIILKFYSDLPEDGGEVYLKQTPTFTLPFLPELKKFKLWYIDDIDVKDFINFIKV